MSFKDVLSLDEKKEKHSPTDTNSNHSPTPTPGVEKATPTPKKRDSQKVGESVDQSIDNSPIMGRPRCFYLTEKQHNDLDIAVKKLARLVEKKDIPKVDRSTVMRLLIDSLEVKSTKTSKLLYKLLVDRLIHQLK